MNGKLLITNVFIVEIV